MIISKEQPKIVTYCLTAETVDEHHTCMWARFVFDCDNGQLNINSDQGDYAYRWGFNEHEDFMSLMARIGDDYLLNKISDRSSFDLEESKKETIEIMKIYAYEENWSHEKLYYVESAINGIESGEEVFYREVCDLIPHIDFEDVKIVKDYPYGARVVVDIFDKFVQPQIKKDFAN